MIRLAACIVVARAVLYFQHEPLTLHSSAELHPSSKKCTCLWFWLRVQIAEISKGIAMPRRIYAAHEDYTAFTQLLCCIQLLFITYHCASDISQSVADVGDGLEAYFEHPTSTHFLFNFFRKG